jgi:hypothetical protein
MISRCYITDILNDLNKGYINSSSPKKSSFYSKLAVIELCGWIEESMNDIIMRCATRKLKLPSSRKYAEKQIVKPNYGFTYDGHFRKMLIQLMGIITTERIERLVDPLTSDVFKSQLKSLKTVRNSEAHTHLKGFTRSIDAPSVTLGRLPSIYSGLNEYDRVIRKHVG